MSKINVLAVFATESVSRPVTTKTSLRSLLVGSQPSVRFVPIDVPGTPAHEASRGPANKLPAGVTVTVLSPTNRKWVAEVTRSESNVFTVR